MCGAKTRSGGSCRQPAMANGRCKMHGGLSLSGADHPGFKTGRYSKALPTRMVQAYEASLNDPDRLALDELIAVVSARLRDLIGRVDTGEAGEHWQAAKNALIEWRKGTATKDETAVRRAVMDLERAIDAGLGDAAAWREVYASIDQYRKLADAERKRQMDMRALISADEALAFGGTIIEVVRRHVRNRDELAAIHRELAGIFAKQRPMGSPSTRVDSGETGG